MTLMTATTPSTLAAGATGTVVTGTAVTSSDTINGNYVGGILVVTNGGGSPINVTFTDPGRTSGGNTGTQAAAPVAAGASRAFRLTSAYVDPTTNLITVAFSGTTSVTYVLYPPA